MALFSHHEKKKNQKRQSLGGRTERQRCLSVLLLAQPRFTSLLNYGGRRMEVMVTQLWE